MSVIVLTLVMLAVPLAVGAYIGYSLVMFVAACFGCFPRPPQE